MTGTVYTDSQCTAIDQSGSVTTQALIGGLSNSGCIQTGYQSSVKILCSPTTLTTQWYTNSYQCSGDQFNAYTDNANECTPGIQQTGNNGEWVKLAYTAPAPTNNTTPGNGAAFLGAAVATAAVAATLF